MVFLRDWVVNIVITMIFVTVVEIMMPGGTTRKYVSLVIGLVVMVVIISPFLTLMVGDFDLGASVLEASRAIALSDVNHRVDRLEQSRRDGIVRLYKSSLEQQIEKDIENAGFAEKVQAVVAIDERNGSEGFGNITSLRVVIEYTPEKDRETGIEEVGRITVKVGDEPGRPENDEASVQREIAQYLSRAYRLPKESISVELQ